MTRLESNDLLMTAYLGALKRTYPYAVIQLEKTYEIYRAEIIKEESDDELLHPST